MPLSAGARIGWYEFLAPIGSGGMGEVWRARDTKLARDVALKILPELFASDPDRLARFQREAQVLASLNHPNIAAIYGLEEAESLRALVLELVEGPTLADRIVQGPIPTDEALRLAKQIAEALEAAHGHGIIHRDLKPSNVKVRPDGMVKVLDFGLAKLTGPPEGGHDVPDGRSFRLQPDLTASPTMMSPAMTRLGVIMGTAAYMSPEQARGSIVDSRADIWSFGVVLYEMLTGTTLFEGPTVSDTLAAVLRADVDWSRLPAGLHPSLRRLLARCLQRDPKQRLQHIGDVRIEIQDIQSGQSEGVPEPKAPKRWGLTLAATALVAVVAGALAWSFKAASVVSGPPTSFIVRTASGAPLAPWSPLALSPDGRHLVYLVGLATKSRLFHQNLGVFEPRPIEGIEDARAPFFSPMSDAIGFQSESTGQLRRLALTGGSATRLADTLTPTGASWGEGGTIVFSPEWGQPLRVTPPDGSEAVNLTRINAAAREGAHLFPQILPGGRAVLFTIWTGGQTWDEAQLAVANLETGDHTIVLRGGTTGLYATSGHLVFWRGSALMAAPFDLDSLTVTGEPVRVVSDVRLNNSNGGAHFALSQTGTLAYVKGGVDTFAESFIAERSGRQVVRLDEAVSTGNPAFSPDGKRVALTLHRGGTFGIGVYDLERRLLTPMALTGDSSYPSWTKDGDRVTFVSNAGGKYNHYSMRFDGGGKPEPIFPADQGFAPERSAWSPDGRHLVYVRSGESTGWDIWTHSPGPEGAPKPLIRTAANENFPVFSPDGHFIAYQSDESGAVEVYVRPFPQVDARRELISVGGGTDPAWSRDGTEILYLTEKGIMKVPVALGRSGNDSITFGQPSLVLEMTGLSNFDISPDGRTLAIERVPIEKAATEIHVVINWFDELKRLVPAK